MVPSSKSSPAIAKVIFFILIGVAPEIAFSCPKNILPNYKFLKSESGVDEYVNTSSSLALSVKCESADITLGRMYESLGSKFSLVKIKNQVFYYDFSAASVVSRTYFLPTKPVMQLSFVTRASNQSALDKTEAQVEILAAEKPH